MRIFRCCKGGRVDGPSNPPPEPLRSLLNGTHAHSNFYRTHARTFNNALAFASLEAKFDQRFFQGPQAGGVYQLRIQGQVHHLIGALLPNEGRHHKFAQIYMLDEEEQLTRRGEILPDVLGRGTGNSILQSLQRMVLEHNPLAGAFRSAARTLIENPDIRDYVLRFADLENEGLDPHVYNRPTVQEVAAFIPEADVEQGLYQQNVVLRTHGGRLQHIRDTCPWYLSLRYPLLHTFGEAGWWPTRPYVDPNNRYR